MANLESISILALFFGTIAFLLSIYAIIKIKAIELSTHRIEYIQEPRVMEMGARAARDDVFDNITDDIDLDKSEI